MHNYVSTKDLHEPSSRVRFKERDYERLVQAAKKSGIPVAVLIRHFALRALERIEREGYTAPDMN